MIEVEAQIRTLVAQAYARGYTVGTVQVTWKNNLKNVSVRFRITPWPDYDRRTGVTKHCISGSLLTIEHFIDNLPTL